MITDKDVKYFKLALHTAQKSLDRTKVGAVLVDWCENFHSTGYNHIQPIMLHKASIEKVAELMRGEVDIEGFTKYELITHAEVDAIMNARFTVPGSTLYCTHIPCMECAKFIVRCGIDRVVTPNKTTVTFSDRGQHMFSLAGIIHEYIRLS